MLLVKRKIIETGNKNTRKSTILWEIKPIRALEYIHLNVYIYLNRNLIGSECGK